MYLHEVVDLPLGVNAFGSLAHRIFPSEHSARAWIASRVKPHLYPYQCRKWDRTVYMVTCARHGIILADDMSPIEWPKSDRSDRAPCEHCQGTGIEPE